MYYTVNDTETFDGFQYLDGLNNLTNIFGDNKKILTFTTAEHIHNLYLDGKFIREVILPSDRNDLQIIDVGSYSKRANHIILGKKYDLSNTNDLKDILQINNNVESIIHMASSNGYTNILDWFVTHPEYEFKYTGYAIDHASGFGRTNVLDWFASHPEYEFKYTFRAIDGASLFGHTNVLDWFA